MIKLEFANIGELRDLFKQARKKLGGSIAEGLRQAQDTWAAAMDNKRVNAPKDDPQLADKIRSPEAVAYPLEGNHLAGEINTADPAVAAAAAQRKGAKKSNKPFDIKPGMLRSPKAKVSLKTGKKYIDVPIRSDPAHPVRRISEKSIDKKGRQHGSAPGSWIHPGFKDDDLPPTMSAPAQAVEQDFSTRVRDAIMSLFR